MNYIARFLLLSLCALALIAPASAHADDAIKEIRISGTQRIEQEAVLTYLGLKTGQTASPYDLDTALKKLYDTGFFSDVDLDHDHGILTVKVTENPSINKIIFEGNERISTEDLEKEVTLKARSIYTRPKVQNDLKRLLDVYRRNGRYSAEINPQVVKLEQNRVNLIYNIVEGPKAYIEKITFIGNDSYQASKLEKIVSSARERWYQFLSDSDKYDPDRLQYDQELLRKFYYENGYADFKVKSAIAELSPQRDAFYLTFTIEEGPVYHLGNVTVNTKLPKNNVPDLTKAITTKEGDLYNNSDIETTVDKMVDTLGDTGFAFVDVTPDTKRRGGDEKIIDLTYNVSEGPKVYVERINIFGNQRTLDEVVRREFRLSEGDAYSSSKLKRTEQRLNNLGFFEKVDIQRKAGSAPDQTQLNVEVKEKSTGEITFGAGYSTTDGPLADIGIKERNFLGRGQELRAKATFAQRRQQYDIGFTEPYFLDRELEAGFDIYKTTETVQDNASYNRESIGGVTKLGYSLSEHLKHQIRYTLEQSKITNVDANASTYIREQIGVDTTSMIGHSLIYDERDSKLTPTSGYYARFNQDVAGAGGDDRFLRHEIQSEYYVPIAKKWTFVTSASAGNIYGLNQDVKINQRFFLGSQQIRGFANAGLGPRDIFTRDALGGNSYYTASGEVRFPLGLPDDLGVSGAAFADFGSLWDAQTSSRINVRDDAAMRGSAGVGVAWASPFGPIRLDFAEAFMKQSYDETQLVRFSFGTRF